MSYLRYMCLFVHSGVQHILCCGIILFFFVCPICCHFLWIVHFWIVFLVFSNVYLQLSSIDEISNKSYLLSNL
jgi:hypothetical protein